MIDHLLSHLHDDTASPEKYEISALASHSEGPNNVGWSDIFCHECDVNICAQGSTRKVAEKAYASGWMVYQGNVLCRECQQR